MTTKKKGCGCGGAGTGGNCSCGGGCGCGGAGCGTCGAQSFVRPLFFSGQLLTEEDLQQLVDYVVQKNRLHNRALFGDGVVCGLQVTCDPCGGGKVVVKPGYAIDCCGNDIVVDCPVTLDINKMVRDLRAKLLGADCGDPCKDKKDDCSDGKPASGRQEIAVTAASYEQPSWLRRKDELARQDEKKNGNKRPDEYCLYIKYCETPIDPVAPYVTDDCSPSSCQATRMAEGFQFELRCQEYDPEPKTIIDSLECCEGDLKELGSVGRAAAWMSRSFGAIAVAARAAERNAKFQMTESDRDELDYVIAELTRLLPGDKIVAAEVERKFTEDEATRGIMLTLELGALLARDMLAAQEHDAKRVTHEKQLGLFNNALNYFHSAPAALDAGFPREFATAALDVAHQVIAKGDKKQLAFRFAGYGAYLSPEMFKAAMGPARALRTALLERAGGAGHTDCKLPKKIAASALPTADVEDTASIWRGAQGIAEVSDAFIEYQRQCLCDAINPPCRDCDEPIVLLACLRVYECQVTEICNLERDFVITWPNMRYWFPEIGKLGEAIEAKCCPESCDGEERPPRDVGVIERALLRRDGFDLGRSAASMSELFRVAAGMAKAPPTFLLRRPATETVTPTVSAETVEKLTREVERLHARIESLESKKKGG